MGHLASALAIRSAAHFGRDHVDHDSFPYAGTADEAIAQLESELGVWRAGVQSLGERGLAKPCGPVEGPFAESPMADLVLHIHREMVHHGAEICLLRDLWTHTASRDG